jgi:hypothetical protein
MRRWFWIIALGFCAFVFAGFAITIFVWAAWTHDLSVKLVISAMGMFGFAALSLDLCRRRIDGPLPSVEPFDLSVFNDTDER